jgi:hypothetical protein
VDQKKTPLELLLKHPVAPIVGGVLLAAAYLTDEPQPPAMTEDLPEATAKQWMMIYNQNQQRFQRRMDLFKDLGMVLLGFGSAQAIMEALPKRNPVADVPALPVLTAEQARAQRGAM